MPGPARALLALMMVVAVAAAFVLTGTPAGTSVAAAATCSDYAAQAAAQAAKDTRDDNGDGIYCESNSCRCTDPGVPGSGRSDPSPAPPKPTPSAGTSAGPMGCRIVKKRVRVGCRRRSIRRSARTGRANAKGWPRTLTVHRKGADQRRDRLLAGMPTRPGKDHDEYPPASARATVKADVKYVDSGQSRGAGQLHARQAAPLLLRSAIRVRLELTERDGGHQADLPRPPRVGQGAVSEMCGQYAQGIMIPIPVPTTSVAGWAAEWLKGRKLKNGAPVLTLDWHVLETAGSPFLYAINGTNAGINLRVWNHGTRSADQVQLNINEFALVGAEKDSGGAGQPLPFHKTGSDFDSGGFDYSPTIAPKNGRWASLARIKYAEGPNGSPCVRLNGAGVESGAAGTIAAEVNVTWVDSHDTSLAFQEIWTISIDWDGKLIGYGGRCDVRVQAPT